MDTDSRQTGVRNPDTLRSELIALHKIKNSWRKVAEIEPYKSVPPGTLCTFAKTGYMPKRWRYHFGLPALVEVAPCSKCGKPHLVPWCTKEAGVKPIRPNGHSKPRTPPIRVGELTEEEREFVMALTPQERKERLTLGM